MCQVGLQAQARAWIGLSSPSPGLDRAFKPDLGPTRSRAQVGLRVGPRFLGDPRPGPKPGSLGVPTIDLPTEILQLRIEFRSNARRLKVNKYLSDPIPHLKALSKFAAKPGPKPKPDPTRARPKSWVGLGIFSSPSPVRPDPGPGFQARPDPHIIRSADDGARADWCPLMIRVLFSNGESHSPFLIDRTRGLMIGLVDQKVWAERLEYNNPAVRSEFARLD
ncbi:hypothetical protein DFH09DRAFT_1081951 [Mycena vulgaris]|nr:hypothetical protein DFH09DRAFT_1081951 [Mycena vulgaris]